MLWEEFLNYSDTDFDYNNNMTMESPVTVAPNAPNFVLCDKVDVEPDVRNFYLFNWVGMLFGFSKAVKDRAKCLLFMWSAFDCFYLLGIYTPEIWGAAVSRHFPADCFDSCVLRLHIYNVFLIKLMLRGTWKSIGPSKNWIYDCRFILFNNVTTTRLLSHCRRT